MALIAAWAQFGLMAQDHKVVSTIGPFQLCQYVVDSCFRRKWWQGDRR